MLLGDVACSVLYGIAPHGPSEVELHGGVAGLERWLQKWNEEVRTNVLIEWMRVMGIYSRWPALVLWPVLCCKIGFLYTVLYYV